MIQTGPRCYGPYKYYAKGCEAKIILLTGTMWDDAKNVPVFLAFSDEIFLRI